VARCALGKVLSGAEQKHDAILEVGEADAVTGRARYPQVEDRPAGTVGERLTARAAQQESVDAGRGSHPRGADRRAGRVGRDQPPAAAATAGKSTTAARVVLPAAQAESVGLDRRRSSRRQRPEAFAAPSP
jgi:hypothetical protein